MVSIQRVYKKYQSDNTCLNTHNTNLILLLMYNINLQAYVNTISPTIHYLLEISLLFRLCSLVKSENEEQMGTNTYNGLFVTYELWNVPLPLKEIICFLHY